MRSREQSDNMAVVMAVTLSFVGNSDPMCSSGARTQFAREKMNVQKHFEEKQKKKENKLDRYRTERSGSREQLPVSTARKPMHVSDGE